MRLGSLAPPTDAQEAQGPTPGPSDFLSPRPQSIRRRVHQEAHPAPRGREGRPQCNVPPENHGPEACRTGKTRSDVKKWWSWCECEKYTVGSRPLIVA